MRTGKTYIISIVIIFTSIVINITQSFFKMRKTLCLLMSPITVSKLPSGKFRLISGERRLRAARLAGLADLPAYVRQADDQQLLELVRG